MNTRRALPDSASDEDGDEVELETTRQDIGATSSTSRISPEEKAATLREVLAALALMATASVMPSQSFWDANKPAHLPRADAIKQRYGLSWSDVARYCRLQLTKPGRRPGVQE